ncbi:MAG TPA: glycoside hydrolase family 15 protein, partial [Thermoleophilaceae bacterium]|nr:glycoside hydrolase family 15 protein [Thermoleophilaceae bacterium]
AQRSDRGSTLTAELDLAEGEHRDLLLELSEAPLDGPLVEAAREWSATEAAWADAVPSLEGVYGRRDARHSYAVLRGLTSTGGGMVAASTASLPERADEGRNYDYRYVWIRDQSYAGQAVAAAGPFALLDDAVRFVSERLLDDGPELMPAYTTTGERVPDQREVGLPGYPGGSDVVGNQINKQFQLDVFGEALLLFAAASRRDRLESEHWRAAEAAVDAIERRWHDPGAGVWELQPKRWAHSRLICAAGLRALAESGASMPQGARWTALADAIVADTAGSSLHSSGRWQRAPDDERVDGSLLLASLRGAVPPDDPRSVATLEAFLADLTEDGYAYRFRHDERPLGQAEGAFLLCGWFVALAHHQQGNLVEAGRWFERHRASCGPAGLFSEEFDVAQRQLRGNLPQAFVHALMLECAVRLSRGPGEPG